VSRSDEQLPASLQEAVLAVLAIDAQYGAIIASQVRPEHFDGQLHDAATAVLAYYRQYRKPPGEAQLVDVIAVGREGDRAATARRLAARLVAQAVTINAAYIASRAGEFVRRQTLLGAVAAATDRFLAGNEEGLLADVEGLLRGALDARRTLMDAGTFLSDAARGLQFLDRQQEGYLLGIDPLDKAGIGLYPKTLTLYVAPKNSGKSWFAVHCGRQALMQGAKVVHVSLEMGDTEVAGRYYQSLFGAGWSSEKKLRAELEFDDMENLSGFKTKFVSPKKVLTDPDAKKWLRGRIQHWGTRLGRLVIREYASGSLTMNELEGYLDYLEIVEGFIPHVLIVDYPDLMEVSLKEFRLGLGRIYVQLRGIAQRRNLAVVAPTQGNRSSLRASNVHADMTSEDISKVFTADTVLSYSQTEGEERLGLARLHVDYARSAARGQTVLLAQSYATGQYVLQSALMRKIYWERLNEVNGDAKKDRKDED
jgi:hypothetical protein